GTRLSDLGRIEDPLVSIEPAVRPPRETIERLVRVLIAETIEQNLRRPVGNVVGIAVGNEEQFRSRADPDTAEADFDAADQDEPFRKDLSGFEPTVAVAVFEDQNAVFTFAFGLLVGVRESFDDP